MYQKDSTTKIRGYVEELKEDMLVVLPSFTAHFSCPFHCGGCCLDFTLDLLPKEYERMKKTDPGNSLLFERRLIDTDRKEKAEVYTHKNTEGKRCDCYHSGGCVIHENRPFSCRFELNKVRKLKEFDFKEFSYTCLGKAEYRDKANMTSELGGPIKCKMGTCHDRTLEDQEDDLMSLIKLQSWYELFTGEENKNLKVLTDLLCRYHEQERLFILDQALIIYGDLIMTEEEAEAIL